MRACERTRTGEPILAFLLDDDTHFSQNFSTFFPFFCLSSVDSFRDERPKVSKQNWQRLRDTLTTRKRRIAIFRRITKPRFTNDRQSGAEPCCSRIKADTCNTAMVGGTSGPRGGPRVVFHFHCLPVSPRRPRASSNSKLARFDFISARDSFFSRSWKLINCPVNEFPCHLQCIYI